MATLQVEIVGWSKRQPRKDVKTSSWFRVDHMMFFDPDWDEFSAEEHHVWCWLLAFASLKNRGELSIETDACASRAKVSVKTFEAAMTKLEKRGSIAITSRSRHADVTRTSRGRIATRQDKTGQDGQDTVPNGTAAPSRPAEPSARSLLPDADGKLAGVFGERLVTEDHQRAWLNAFPDPPWIASEIHKALAWEVANPKRRKKNFAAFVTNWLGRGWDKRRHEPVVTGKPQLTDLDELGKQWGVT